MPVPSSTPLAEVEALTAALGRPLRVLHIGNIANNGFNNARIQRAHGVAADVLCADNYHIMATPEWEEAPIRERPADDFFPDWGAVDLGNYRRPRWFAAAPLADACRYLEAYAGGDDEGAERLWRVMERERHILCSRRLPSRSRFFIRKIGLKLAYERKKVEIRLGLHQARVEDEARLHGALHLAAIKRLWGEQKGEWPFPAKAEDFAHYWERIAPVARLLPHYDIIQGYAQDGIWALLMGRAYAAYEHGTLRQLPFEDHAVGRLVALVYGLADQVFVTNSDVLPSIARLGLEAQRVHCLPHAFDEQKLTGWRDAHPAIIPASDEVVFFSPTRQHWRDADMSLTKGNDIMLHAAGRLWASGRRFRIILVEWGQDVVASKQLIHALGLDQAVRWVPPMGKQDLWRAYCFSHAVLDQFVLPALGGVGFETLALGCRLISRTDPPTLAGFFGASPPVLPAASIDDVAASLARVIDDPQDNAAIGPAGRVWIETYHSARRIVAMQAQAYQTMIKA
ncbi:MAG: glycosyltransferase [Beijerinckiaceae bacterium]